MRPHVTGAARAGSSIPHCPTCDPDVSARLVRSFDAASAGRAQEGMPPLREAAVEFVGHLKQRGLSAEQVIVAMKTLLGGHGPAGWAPSLYIESRMPRAARESTVYASLFGWCLETYYGQALHGQPCASGDLPPAAARGDALHRRAP